MTVGLYLNNPLPIMISDCLALPSKGKGKKFNPSNIEFYDGLNGELVQLVSKFIYADDNTIITFAGGYGDIKEFVDHFPDLWEKRDTNTRPMVHLGELDCQLRAVRQSWNCSVLGAAMIANKIQGERGLANNYASPNKNRQFHTKHFGNCFSIGTGSKELRRFIENADRNISRQGKVPDNFLFMLLGALNGKTLYCQESEVEEQTWGGILQAQIFYDKEQRWLRTPPWLHMCLYFKGKDLEFIGTHPKTVLHTSVLNSPHNSAVFTDTVIKNEERLKIIWPIFSPFTAPEHGQGISNEQIFEEPNQITLTAFIQLEAGQKVNHVTVPFSAVSGVRCILDSNEFYFDVNLEDLSDWYREQMFKDPFIKDFLG